MHCILIIICLFCLNGTTSGQSKLGLEQYSYVGTGQPGTLVPVAHYQAKSNWYAEARYNYDEVNTFSLYAGRTFSGERALSYSVTPMIGGMAGQIRGGSLALNTEFNYRSFNFSSQSQYSINAETRMENYFFSWSELSYQPLDWLYAGVSLQNTHIYRTDGLVEPGLLVGLSYKQWNFPVYSFNPFADGRYFIIGLNWEFSSKSASKQKPVPVLVQNP
jgi:hypothetical protein